MWQAEADARSFGMTVDMSQPIYRHLLEKQWRKEGRLDLLVRHRPSVAALM